MGQYLKGVHSVRSGRFQARVMYKGKVYYLGTYETEEEAHEEYLRLLNQLNSKDKSKPKPPVNTDPDNWPIPRKPTFAEGTILTLAVKRKLDRNDNNLARTPFFGL